MKDIRDLLFIIAKTDVSVLLIAPQGHGKSTLIQQTKPIKSLEMNDFTAMSLVSAVSKKRHPERIIAPDFNICLSHKSSVSQLLVAQMLYLVGEGAKNLGAGKKVIKFKKRLNISFTLGITPRVLSQHMKEWIEIGLCRRLLPVAWHWSEELKIKMLDEDDDHALGYDFPLILKNGLPRTLSKAEKTELKSIAIELTLALKWEWKSGEEWKSMDTLEEHLSMYKTLKKLACASSIEDIRRLKYLFTYNYRRNKIELPIPRL